MPREIVLTMDDGTTFHHPGPALELCVEGLDQIRAGHGPIVEVVGRTVHAKGCGLLWQVLAALAPAQDES